MTITEALSVEHSVFRAIFEQVERDLPNLSLPEIKTVVSVIENLLHRHGDQEKDLALAALNHALAEQGEFDRLQLEHHELDAALRRVKSAQELTEARRLLQLGLSASRQHFAYEERTLFPLIGKVLPGKALRELGQAWLQHQSKET